MGQLGCILISLVFVAKVSSLSVALSAVHCEVERLYASYHIYPAQLPETPGTVPGVLWN